MGGGAQCNASRDQMERSGKKLNVTCNDVKDLIVRTEGSCRDWGRRVGDNFSPMEPSVLFVYPRQPAPPTPANCSPEYREPAFPGSLRHWPPTQSSPSLHMAQCLPLCAGWEGRVCWQVLRNPWEGSRVRWDP